MDVIVTGSIAFDYLMRFPGSFREHIHTEALEQISLSFLVEDMTRHWGGVAANIAYTMAKLGLRPRLMGTAGRDFGDYRDWLQRAGVDTSTVRQHDHVFTASFFCNTDDENNQLASFYSGAMAYAREYPLAEIVETPPDMVIISPNDPQAMANLSAECRQRGWRFVYDPSQQIARMDGETLRRDMDGAYMMVVNQYEAHMISDKTGLSLDDLRHMIDLLIITNGKNGSTVYENGSVSQVPAFEPDHLLDPTGAGDAYRAGLITGLMHDLPVALAAAMGALSATYALEHIGPQGHDYTPETFIQRFRQLQDDQGKLDILMS